MISRLISYISGFKKWALLGIVLLVIAKAIEVVIPALLGHTAQVILDLSAPIGRVGQLSLIAIALVVGGYVLETGIVLLMNTIGQVGVYRLRTHLFDHLQHLHIAFFDKQRVGQLMSRTIGDVDRIEKGLSEGVISLFTSLLLLVGILIGMFFVDWHLAVIICCVLPFLLLLANRFRIGQKRGFKWVRAALGALNTFVQEHLTGARIIRNFGLAGQEATKFAGLNREYRDANLQTIRNYASFFASMDWIHSAMLVGLFVGLAEWGISGEQFRAGVFFAFSLYLLAFFRPVFDVIERYNVLQEAMAAGHRIFEVLDTQRAVRSDGTATLEKIDQIAFEGVWFAYNDEEWVLKDVSFTLDANQTVALVGETGSGKTTTFSLLMRFYDPQKGQITINGRDIRDYPLKTLRTHFSTVLQDPVIFSGTVRENLSLYRTAITDPSIQHALDYVGADFVTLDTPLLERGKSLSQGERQLLSLARAVAHNRSAIIFDEATANIDSITEHKIQQALQKLLGNKTTLVIAHRLSTIRQATKIVVLDHGRIVEQGSHDSLLAAKGFYEKLYRLQFTDSSGAT